MDNSRDPVIEIYMEVTVYCPTVTSITTMSKRFLDDYVDGITFGWSGLWSSFLLQLTFDRETKFLFYCLVERSPSLKLFL